MSGSPVHKNSIHLCKADLGLGLDRQQFRAACTWTKVRLKSGRRRKGRYGWLMNPGVLPARLQKALRRYVAYTSQLKYKIAKLSQCLASHGWPEPMNKPFAHTAELVDRWAAQIYLFADC